MKWQINVFYTKILKYFLNSSNLLHIRNNTDYSAAIIVLVKENNFKGNKIAIKKRYEVISLINWLILY